MRSLWFYPYLQPLIDSEVGYSIPRKVIDERASSSGVPVSVVRRVSKNGVGNCRVVLCIPIDAVCCYGLQSHGVPPPIAADARAGIDADTGAIVGISCTVSSDLTTSKEELNLLPSRVVPPVVMEETLKRLFGPDGSVSRRLEIFVF